MKGRNYHHLKWEGGRVDQVLMVGGCREIIGMLSLSY